MADSLMDSSCVSIPQLEAVKSELLASYLEFSERGLLQSAEWACDLAKSLQCSATGTVKPESEAVFSAEHIDYYHAKSLYDLREFKRSASMLKNCKSDKCFFLRCYCIYLDGEKQKEDSIVDVIGDSSTIINQELTGLRRQFVERMAGKSDLDGYCCYLYGVILKQLKLEEEAREFFLKACRQVPVLWAAWYELAKTCTDRDMLYGLAVPDCWVKMFFLAAGSLELHLNEEAVGYYLKLSENGFERSSYVMGQLALAFYNIKEFSKSLEQFQMVQASDPYLLANMDILSHILFVKEMLPELTVLAQNTVNVDRYRFETLCTVANLYSLRGEHEKAITYFEMATKVNLCNQSTWVLLGHEYLELKNLNMAVEAYSKAIEVNKKDFRGYYGLGQTYELMKVPNLALHFYMKAHKLKPNDSRMLMALGDCHHSMDHIYEAVICYKRAIGMGDSEQMAIVKLADLNEKLGDKSDAADLYARFVTQAESTGSTQLHVLSKACTFLAKFHLEMGNLQEAESFAEKASKLSESQAEGKSLLNEIALRRSKMTDSQDGQKKKEFHLLDFEISPIS